MRELALPGALSVIVSLSKRGNFMSAGGEIITPHLMGALMLIEISPRFPLANDRFSRRERADREGKLMDRYLDRSTC